MKTQSIRRGLSATVATAIVLAGAAFFAAPAGAVVVGTMSLNPATGTGLTPTSYQTSGICSNASDNVRVTVVGGSGAGAVLTLPKNIVGSNAPNPSGAGMAIAAFQTWSDFATTNGLTALNGAYTVSALCTVSGDHFDATVNFVGVDKVNATYASVRPTTTTLSPATSSVSFGSAATVTANVSSDATPTGSVQFKVDGTNSGSAVAVGATGNAVFNTPTNLASGSHTITADFTPDVAGIAAGFAASSNTVGVSVTVTKANSAVTGLTTNPAGTAPAGTPVTLSATISPAGLAGTVTFYNGGTVSGGTVTGGTVVGTSSTNVAGVFSTTWNIPALATGAQTLNAVFVPADLVNTNAPTTVGTGTLTVSAPTTPVSQSTGQVTIILPAGTLAVSTPAAMTLSVGSNNLSANGKYFIATGVATPVIVTDTRAGDFGWNLKVQSTDFVGTKGGTGFGPGNPNYNPKYSWQKNVINAYNFGYAPFGTSLTPYGTSTSVNSGVAQVPVGPPTGLSPTTDPVLPGVTPSYDTGFGAPRQVLVGTGGGGIGSATGQFQLDGQFLLNIPTVTIADTYVATLTYTLTGY